MKVEPEYLSPEEERRRIDEYIARHGVRRFRTGQSSEDLGCPKWISQSRSRANAKSSQTNAVKHRTKRLGNLVTSI